MPESRRAALARPSRFVALLRGVNVGTAKRLAMADLRAVVAGAGYAEVATVLNSGNVVFTVPEGDGVTPTAEGLRSAILTGTGVDCDVVLLAAERFVALADGNPLRRSDRDPKKLCVAFTGGPLDVARASAAAPSAEAIAPEELVIAPEAVYQWLPNGVLASPVPATFWAALGTVVTVRNDSTVQRIVARL